VVQSAEGLLNLLNTQAWQIGTNQHRRPGAGTHRASQLALHAQPQATRSLVMPKAKAHHSAGLGVLPLAGNGHGVSQQALLNARC
tara:strand:- start:193 stop:447 length:255 start_codon:yes stop_codon:yes gene_type:complete